ncbi:hypothetical protein K488DRAFT_51732 [Vararia minispora EC-137]|uniref:Uncharacterized protein n=1 Tax=Vararia minispora EC-137 TaxID=1314806 RepID=A0ACB8QII9_9AGAM|nr:hypothetical protein K488DRAFT_51732 [Vararia minispora EC-137]
MLLPPFFLLLPFLAALRAQPARARCRTQPGDARFPSRAEWDRLNTTVAGRLIAVVPSALACAEARCNDAQWSSALFRDGIPGQMNAYNWEQLCLYNTTDGACAQANVPLFAINATLPEHVQAGVAFSAQHDLRVAIKSSGHDYLGRSTNRGALLLWTQYMKNVTFTSAFIVGGEDQGSAVTVGSGMGLRAIYTAVQAQGKMVVGGTAATVSAGGGYIQGAGHSAFSPMFGLAADNVLQFEVVLADGSFVVANAVSHPDLFWALRGGGAGSWGVVTSVTLRTFPTFTAAIHTATVLFASSADAAAGMRAHATHISDYDTVRAGQYFYLFSNGPGENAYLQLNTLVINASADAATQLVAPLLADLVTAGGTLANQSALVAPAQAIVGFADDRAGYNTLLGSRLVPLSAYTDAPDRIEETYRQLLDFGVGSILGHLLGGGKVAENAVIDSAVHPKWRTAKTHVIATTTWADSTPAADVLALKANFTATVLPLLAAMTGEPDSGAYSNEADVDEPNFRTTFFGAHYARLSAIKAAYDPRSLFVVRAGVGSELWDADGMCTVAGSTARV